LLSVFFVEIDTVLSAAVWHQGTMLNYGVIESTDYPSGFLFFDEILPSIFRDQKVQIPYVVFEAYDLTLKRKTLVLWHDSNIRISTGRSTISFQRLVILFNHDLFLMLTLGVLKLLKYVVLFSCLIDQGYAQCNGQSEVCSKPYNEVAFLTTHNAYNTGSEGFSLPNHNYGVAQQLQDGVRAFMLDVYSLFGTTVQYHGTFTLGSQDLNDDLVEIRQFLDNNPNEVVTLILECYVSAATMEHELNVSGLSSYLFTKVAGQPWPTIQEMIDNNERLVVFTDEDDAGAGQDWYHYAWDYMVETHYSVNDVQDFTDQYNRGDASNDLFIFNHFVTSATLGTGSESDSQIANEYTFLMDRILNHYAGYQKFPNFITLDFYEHGGGLQVVQDLNAGILSVEPTAQIGVTLYPNPVQDRLVVKLQEDVQLQNVAIYDARGVLVAQGQDKTIDMSEFTPGIYLVKVQTNLGVVSSRVICN
jgi:hypothetical protein